MSRRKRSSKTLEQAQIRLAALKSIHASLDLGNGLTIDKYLSLIDDSRQKLEAYNTALSIIDQNYNSFLESERLLAELSERMLIGVASKYGKNSDEYQMAGGVRRRDRKRVTRRTEEKTTPTLMAVTENSTLTSQMQ